MSVKEVAKLLGRSEQMVRRYIRTDGLPYSRAEGGKRLIFNEDEVLAWRNRPEIASLFAFGDRTLGRWPSMSA